MSNSIHPIQLNADNFDAEVINSAVPVLVDFWAPWCGPCRVMNPVVETLANELDGKAKVAKLNIDDNVRLASRYGISAVPTFVIFHEGRMVNMLSGVVSQDKLVAALDAVLVA